MSRPPSSFVLILANLIPVAGVLLFQWDVVSILLLYWAESVVIGVVNVLRMVTCQSENILGGVIPQLLGKSVTIEPNANLPNIPIAPFKFLLIPFFVFHYGAFCFGHLVAIVGLFADSNLNLGTTSSLVALWQPTFWIAVAAIAGSHLFSFFSNYIGKDERKRTSLFMLMRRPYGRIIVMHITIVFGAGLVIWFGSPLPLLLVLISAKILFDLKLHAIERGKMGLVTPGNMRSSEVTI